MHGYKVPGIIIFQKLRRSDLFKRKFGATKNVVICGKSSKFPLIPKWFGSQIDVWKSHFSLATEKVIIRSEPYIRAKMIYNPPKKFLNPYKFVACAFFPQRCKIRICNIRWIHNQWDTLKHIRSNLESYKSLVMSFTKCDQWEDCLFWL